MLGLVLSLAMTAAAATGDPQLRVNGKDVSTGAHIQKDRLFIQAKAYAQAIGATYSEDAKTGALIIDTGNGIPTLAKLQEINPKLSQYEALSPYIPSMGIHRGVRGPHITLAVSNEGTVNAVEILSPEAAGWFPWFDQPEGQAMELEGMGKVYTQHIYLTNPAGLMPDNAGVPVIIDGRYLSFPWEPKAHRMSDGTVFIPARPAVEALGGSIHWDNTTRSAAATVKTGPLTWEQLKALNPKLSLYEALSPLVPNMGIHMGVRGPGLIVLTDTAGKVVGFETTVPSAAAPWAPWFDQPEGQPSDLPGLGKIWSQHIYLVDPTIIK